MNDEVHVGVASHVTSICISRAQEDEDGNEDSTDDSKVQGARDGCRGDPGSSSIDNVSMTQGVKDGDRDHQSLSFSVETQEVGDQMDHTGITSGAMDSKAQGAEDSREDKQSFSLSIQSSKAQGADDRLEVQPSFPFSIQSKAQGAVNSGDSIGDPEDQVPGDLGPEHGVIVPAIEQKWGSDEVKTVNWNDIPSWGDINRDQPEGSYGSSIMKKVSLWKGDITRLGVDVVVNAAKESLSGGGGVDGAIHEAAGPRLAEECANLGGCEAGQVKVTAAYGLPAHHIIHTVGPRDKDEIILAGCYRHSVEALKKLGMSTIAFPCIATGNFGFPPRRAAEIAIGTTRDFLVTTKYPGAGGILCQQQQGHGYLPGCAA